MKVTGTRHARALRAGLAGMTLALAWLPSGGAPPVGSLAAGSAINVQLDTSHTVGALPPDFAGISFEESELGHGTIDAGTGNLVALFQGLGQDNLRLGGNTLDRDDYWNPSGGPLPSWALVSITPADIANLATFLQATGWKAEVGLNMGHQDNASIANMAGVVKSDLGSSLQDLACGNEPNSWSGHGLRPAGFSFAMYEPEWQACVAAANTPHIAAPDTTQAWYTNLIAGDRSRFEMLTQHTYPLGPGATITQLLSPSIDSSELSTASGPLAAANGAGLPMRMDETNSTVGGGTLGTSDVYGSALWGLDYSLLMAKDGEAGLNFHSGLGVCDAPLSNGRFQHYTAICPATAADAAAKVYMARPLYYGIWMAQHMGPGHFYPLTLSLLPGFNATAYAVKGDDGLTRIAIIDKDAPGSMVGVSIAGIGSATSAQMITMTGPSLTSTTGTMVQGASVDAAGHLNPGAPDTMTASQGSFIFNMPTGSAAILTLGTSCTPAPPGTPMSTVATANGGGSATVTWDSPSTVPCAPATAFAIYAYPNDGTGVQVTTNSNSFVVNGLSPGYHVFTVVAFSAAANRWGGWSNWSPWTMIT